MCGLSESTSAVLGKLRRNCTIRRRLREAQTSSALDISESRLGLSWKSAGRRRLCDDGRMWIDRALFTNKSPSTVPILTSEFFIADLRIYKCLLERYGVVWPWLLCCAPLWRLHLNEPGWVVGEHMQVLFWFDGKGRCVFCFDFRGETAMERLRAAENRTEGEGETVLLRRTRFGDMDRVNKLPCRVEKVDDADEQKRSDGDNERWMWWWNSGRSDLFLDDDLSICTRRNRKKKRKSNNNNYFLCLERRLGLILSKTSKREMHRLYRSSIGGQICNYLTLQWLYRCRFQIRMEGGKFSGGLSESDISNVTLSLSPSLTAAFIKLSYHKSWSILLGSILLYYRFIFIVLHVYF